MHALIYAISTGEVIATAEDRPSLRERLFDLREQKKNEYILVDGETREAALIAAGRAAGRSISDRAFREAVLRVLPPVQGRPEITKDEWEACMEMLSPRRRGYVANLAAHSWAVKPLPNGVRLTTWGHSEDVIGDDATKVEVDRCCASCEMSKRYVAVRGGETPLTCALGQEPAYKVDAVFGTRKVGRIQVCDGYKPAK